MLELIRLQTWRRQVKELTYEVQYICTPYSQFSTELWPRQKVPPPRDVKHVFSNPPFKIFPLSSAKAINLLE